MSAKVLLLGSSWQGVVLTKLCQVKGWACNQHMTNSPACGHNGITVQSALLTQSDCVGYRGQTMVV